MVERNNTDQTKIIQGNLWRKPRTTIFSRGTDHTRTTVTSFHLHTHCLILFCHRTKFECIPNIGNHEHGKTATWLLRSIGLPHRVSLVSDQIWQQFHMLSGSQEPNWKDGQFEARSLQDYHSSSFAVGNLGRTSWDYCFRICNLGWHRSRTFQSSNRRSSA